MESKGFDEMMKRYTREKYLTQQELLFRIKPAYQGSFDALWKEVLKYRSTKGREIPLKDQLGQKFWFMEAPCLQKLLHQIDFVAKKELEEVAAKEIYKELLTEKMLDEAFYSSVIEGAFTTKQRTKELVHGKKSPKNKSEKMVLNNFYAMEYILTHLDQDIDEELFLTLHGILTKDTLAEEDRTEKYRDDLVYVKAEGQSDALYTGLEAKQVPEMMSALFQFIKSDFEFINPILKAHIIHFYIGYVHPFFDGNGRIARAISYMFLLQNGYDFFKFFSISSIIYKQRKKYYQAFLDSETGERDLTYFLMRNSELVLDSINEVIDQLIKAVNHELIIKKLQEEDILLADRQIKFMKWLARKDSNLITIEEYRKKMRVSYETARTDLLELTALGILKQEKKGKKYIYKFVGLRGYL